MSKLPSDAGVFQISGEGVKLDRGWWEEERSGLGGRQVWQQKLPSDPIPYPVSESPSLGYLVLCQ